MNDYTKLKVTDLKAELKSRGIPQTGLRVKQQFIDRLIEDDAKGGGDATNGEAAPEPEPAQETPQPPVGQPAEEPAPVAATQPEEQKPEEPAQVPEPEPQAPEAAPEVPERPPSQEAPVADKPAEQPPQEPTAEPPSQPAEPEQSKNEPAAKPQVPEPTDNNESPAPPAPQPQTDGSTQPVEQAPDVAATLPPSDTEPTKPTEPTDSSVPQAPSVSGANTGLSTPLPQEEILEDQRKRKRRSLSPVPTVEAVANKKMKAQEEVALPEDKDGMEVDRNTDQDMIGAPQEASTADYSRGKKDHPSKQDVRFKGLFAPSESEQPRAPSPPPDVDMDETAEPAQHVATPALYVDGLMRPLQPAALRNHLVSLAAAPGDSPNPDAIVEFYLDPIKTHSFVSFTNLAAASRVRAALHNTVWPNERNRKSLFVDFIPESKLQEWVNKEESSRKRGGPPPRWEVKYERTADGVDAILREIDPRGPAPRAPEPSDFSRPPPLGPRAEMGQPGRRPSDHAPAPAPERPSQPGQGFKPLDDLFMSTTTKPKLYYLPVPRSVADRRLDQFDDLLSKGAFPRRGGDEMRRISFEDGDLFVDNGPEFGRRGGGPPGRGRGGGRGRGRGGFGDSWRGGRGGRY